MNDKRSVVYNMSIYHHNEYIFINLTIRENHLSCEQYRNQSSLYNKAKPPITSPTLYLLIRVHFIRPSKYKLH